MVVASTIGSWWSSARRFTVEFGERAVRDPTAVCVLLMTVALVVLVSINALPRVDPRALSRPPLENLPVPEPGVDDLPLVRVDYGKYKPPIKIPGDDDDDGGRDAEERRRLCLGSGLYLGTENEWTDCRSLCNADAVDYRYYEGSEADNPRIIVGRRRRAKGGYCVPTAAARCNTRSSVMLYTYTGWSCISQVPALRGEGGNLIAVCNGSIRDNALELTYDGYIPSNLAFNDFYRDKLGDGSYRFTCVPGTRDSKSNRYISSDLDRFHLMQNYCTEDIPYAAEISRDPATGECACAPQYEKDRTNGKCTACKLFASELTLETFPIARACWTSGDTREYVTEIAARSKGGPPNPCGFNYMEKIDESGPRCVAPGVLMFNALTTSPANLLETIGAQRGRRSRRAIPGGGVDVQALIAPSYDAKASVEDY